MSICSREATKYIAMILITFVVLPILGLFVLTQIYLGRIAIATDNILILVLSRSLEIFFMSLHIWIILAFVLIGVVFLYTGFYYDEEQIRLIGVSSLIGFPFLMSVLLIFGVMTPDPYFSSVYVQSLISEIIAIGIFTLIGLFMTGCGKIFIGSLKCRGPQGIKIRKLLSMFLIIVAILIFTLIATMIDMINSFYVGPLTEIEFLGFVGYKQEIFQTIFLLGLFAISFPSVVIAAWWAGKNNLSKKQIFYLLLVLLPICSAVWDLFYIIGFAIPQNISLNTVGPWWDPFGLSILQGLNTMQIEGGSILMDAEFMIIFSIIRLGIFIPLLSYQIWRMK